jgi:single-strand DNA-binding protein
MAFHRNQVELIGNVGADPEVRYLPSGDAVANIRLATTEKWKDKASGEQKEATEWHRISVFGRLAEIVSEYVKKGSHIFVVGRIKTRKYQAADGTDRYSTEIQVSELGLLGSPRTGDGSQGTERPARESKPGGTQRAAAPAGGGFDEMDDDIPF